MCAWQFGTKWVLLLWFHWFGLAWQQFVRQHSFNKKWIYNISCASFFDSQWWLRCHRDLQGWFKENWIEILSWRKCHCPLHQDFGKYWSQDLLFTVVHIFEMSVHSCFQDWTVKCHHERETQVKETCCHLDRGGNCAGLLDPITFVTCQSLCIEAKSKIAVWFICIVMQVPLKSQWIMPQLWKSHFKVLWSWLWMLCSRWLINSL